MARDYGAAIEALNTLQSNFNIVEAIRKSRQAMNQNAIPEMRDWCRKVGYEPSEFNKLNIIHIAGTKGKGSTSAFISSILCQYLPSKHTSTSNGESSPSLPQKIGLFTSPHLRSVRERIRINDEPISEELFAKYFFEVWDRFDAYAAQHRSTEPDGSPSPTHPAYFRFLTLMAFHTYISEGVDTAVIECGIGGEYDSTNILEAPTVAAVTNLGIDHTSILGDTITDIAWHKAGIFKPASASRSAYTAVSQPPAAMSVLASRATDAGLTLQSVPIHPDIASGAAPLGLAADFQQANASLAVATTAAHLRALGVPHIPDPLSTDSLPAPFRAGLAAVHWPGRCELRRQRNVAWHLDGGHTAESLALAAAWFVQSVSSGRPHARRVLLFNQQTRNADALARTLHAALRAGGVEHEGGGAAPLFDVALFCTNVTFDAAAEAGPGRYKADLLSINTNAADVERLTVQRGLAKTWAELEAGRGGEVGMEATAEGAVRRVREIAKEVGREEDVVVLVTGSLHLVGAVLEVLEELPE